MIILKFLSAQGIFCLKIVLVLSVFQNIIICSHNWPSYPWQLIFWDTLLGRGVLLVVQIEFVLFKEDFHPASLFLIGGPKVLLKKCWRALPTFSHLWRWNLKIYLEFYLFYNYIDGFSFFCLLPFEL